MFYAYVHSTDGIHLQFATFWVYISINHNLEKVFQEFHDNRPGERE